MLNFDCAEKSEILSIGLLSGTSVDGVDVGLTKISQKKDSIQPELLAFETILFQPGIRNRIQNIINRPQVELKDISQMNFLLGKVFADAALTFITKQRIPLRTIDFIASHGQTFWHEPHQESIESYAIRSTYQLGEAAVIAKETLRPVISDFRVADVASGGEGAPLMPYLDYVLFQSGDKNRLIVNIGGISNLTAIKAGGSFSEVIFFDCGPGNILIDKAAQQLFNSSCDTDGLKASQGQIHEPLLHKLLNDPYYDLSPPKSTGREKYNDACFQAILLSANEQSLTDEDLIATLSELTVRVIHDQYQHFVTPKINCSELIVSGGGSKNPFIMQRLKKRFSSQTVKTIDDCHNLKISSDGKEAVLFSVLGYQFLNQQSASLKTPAILGKLSLPPLSSK